MYRYVLIGCLAGCIEPSLVECADGLDCSVGQVCDEIHHGCVSPDQIAACASAMPGADCNAGVITGGCFDGVCLPRGCGNGIVEPGEVCDDGNQLSGDGCRGDCKSNEQCGNGVVDTDEHETCDDGNLMSHDGCDSHRQIETTAWTILPMQPGNVSRDNVAYDEAGHVLVAVTDDGVTWVWDGMAWNTSTPPVVTLVGQHRLFFDPDRGHIDMVDVHDPGDNTMHAFLSTWNGTQWTPLSDILDVFPSVNSIPVAVYDRANHWPLIALNNEDYSGMEHTVLWSIDDTNTWQPGPGAGLDLTEQLDITAGYDPIAAGVIILAGHRDVGTGEYYSLEWSLYMGTWSAAQTNLSASGLSLFYDGALGHLTVIDSSAILERIGSTWTFVNGSVPIPVVAPALTYETATDTLTLLRGDANTILQWSGGAWIVGDGPAPIQPTSIAADPITHRLLIRGGDATNQTWSWNGMWQRMVPAQEPGARTGQVMESDPARGAIVMHGGTFQHVTLDDTWVWDGMDWTELGSAQPVATPDVPPNGLGYDPTLPGVELDYSTRVWSLPATDTSWSLVGAAPSLGATNDVSSFAWDASRATIVAVSDAGIVYDRIAGGWQTSLSLVGSGYRALSDARRGTVVMIPLDGVGTRVWGVSTARGPKLCRYRCCSLAPARTIRYSAGSCSSGSRPAVRTCWSGRRPAAHPTSRACPARISTRTASIDCADPDCWWQCTPACPPYTTCP